MNRILLLEDDVSLIDGLVYSLKKNEFDVEVARTVCEAKQYLSELDRYDLLILDVTLPDGTGFDICEKVRKENQQIPIIFLTASDEEVSIIRGLDSGGDDYITKPFRPLVLGAKVKALIRRNKNLVLDNSDTLECGPFSYDTTTMRFYKNGEELILSSKESALLLLFMKNPQQVFTKDMIYEHVWGNTVAVDDNAIMVYINRLRGKIEDDRQNPAYILTIRGLGYRFVP